MQFSNGWSKSKISKLVYKYTKHKYLEIVPWPLFNDHTYTKTESKAARDFFVDYIVDMCNKEDKKEWKKMKKLR